MSLFKLEEDNICVSLSHRDILRLEIELQFYIDYVDILLILLIAICFAAVIFLLAPLI